MTKKLCHSKKCRLSAFSSFLHIQNHLNNEKIVLYQNISSAEMCKKRFLIIMSVAAFRRLLPVGEDVQRKGKEVKRRRKENHVCSPPCTALSFLSRLVVVTLHPLTCSHIPKRQIHLDFGLFK